SFVPVCGNQKLEPRRGTKGTKTEASEVQGPETFQDMSWIRRVEGVALTDVAGLEALFEPADALGGGAVCERIGRDVAAGLALEAVVADRAGGVQGRLHVARFENVLHLLGVMRPHAGQEIGLELETDRQGV